MKSLLFLNFNRKNAVKLGPEACEFLFYPLNSSAFRTVRQLMVEIKYAYVIAILKTFVHTY